MRFSFIIICFWGLTLTIQSQSILNIVEKTGELTSDSLGKLSFEVSTASLNVSFKRRFPAYVIGSDPTYTIFNFVVGVSTLKGTKDLFSKGAFNPGANLSLTASIYDQDKGAGYWVYRGRLNYDIQEIKSVANVDTIFELSNKAYHSIGLDITIAKAFVYDFVVGTTLSAKIINNSPGNLKTKQVSEILATGNSLEGEQYAVLDNEDRYYGNLLDVENKGEIGFDMFYNCLKIENGPSIALLASLITSFSKYSIPNYNISIGPSLQPPSNTRLIVFATLFEAQKITSKFEWRNFLKDHFKFRLYIGIPFDIFK